MIATSELYALAALKSQNAISEWNSFSDGEGGRKDVPAKHPRHRLKRMLNRALKHTKTLSEYSKRGFEMTMEKGPKHWLPVEFLRIGIRVQMLEDAIKDLDDRL